MSPGPLPSGPVSRRAVLTTLFAAPGALALAGCAPDAPGAQSDVQPRRPPDDSSPAPGPAQTSAAPDVPPDARYPANVAGDALARKVDVFRGYAQDDAVTAACHDEKSCLAVPRFGPWLQREYLESEADLARG
jgi:hypothetical protein